MTVILSDTTKTAAVIRRILMFYPPGPVYQRGEDRCQGNIEQSTATSMRAPNDMGYVAALLKKNNYDVFFRDYASLNESEDRLIADVQAFDPQVLLTSITTSTITDDLALLKRLKDKFPALCIIIKGALFYKASPELLKTLDLGHIDYLIGGEIEFSASQIVELLNGGAAAPHTIPGIFYRGQAGWQASFFDAWETDIDALPFPDRSVLDNHLYLRPDTGEPQATIATSRGCPAACIYCLTPTITGKKVRFRDPASIIEELRDCYHNHGIRNFFFKSDTFTIDHDWVTKVCQAIMASDLNGKIEWVANSRVRPLVPETLKIMKQAGCWLIAFGFESGSPETMKKIKKGATIEDNIRAARLAHEAGLKIYGFFMIGLPWEDVRHLDDTCRHIYEIDADFIELHVAVPYTGTELHEIAKKEGLLKAPVFGQNYFSEATTGTHCLSAGDLDLFRRRLLLRYHVRPSYIIRRLADIGLNPRKFMTYARFGWRLLANSLRTHS